MPTAIEQSTRVSTTEPGYVMSVANSREQLEVLQVRIGGGIYGIESGHVVEVLERPDLSPVPETEDLIAGIDRQRGEITVFVDPGSVLDSDSSGQFAVILESEPDETPVAVLVSEVLSIQRYDVQSIAPAEDFDIDGAIFSAGVDTDDGVLSLFCPRGLRTYTEEFVPG